MLVWLTASAPKPVNIRSRLAQIGARPYDPIAALTAAKI
jgi:hypothetical protein